MERGVEQLVARRAHNPKVAGSSPATATQMKRVDRMVGPFLMFWARRTVVYPLRPVFLQNIPLAHSVKIKTL